MNGDEGMKVDIDGRLELHKRTSTEDDVKTSRLIMDNIKVGDNNDNNSDVDDSYTSSIRMRSSPNHPMKSPTLTKCNTFATFGPEDDYTKHNPRNNRAIWTRDMAWRKSLLVTLILAIIVLLCIIFIPILTTPINDLHRDTNLNKNSASPSDETLTSTKNQRNGDEIRFQIIANPPLSFQSSSSSSAMSFTQWIQLEVSTIIGVPNTSLTIDDIEALEHNRVLISILAHDSTVMSGAESATMLLLLVRKGDIRLSEIGLQSLIFADTTITICSIGHRGEKCDECIYGYEMTQLSQCQHKSTDSPQNSTLSQNDEWMNASSTLFTPALGTRERDPLFRDVNVRNGVVNVFSVITEWETGFDATIMIAYVDGHKEEFVNGFEVRFDLPIDSTLQWLTLVDGDGSRTGTRMVTNRQQQIIVLLNRPFDKSVIEIMFGVRRPNDQEASVVHGIMFRELSP